MNNEYDREKQDYVTGSDSQSTMAAGLDRDGPAEPGQGKAPEKKKKKGRKLIWFLTTVLFVAVSFYLGRQSVLNHPGSSNRFDNKAVMTKIQQLESYISAFYLDKVDEKKVTDGIYKGLMSGLEDPYSEYYNEDDYQGMMETDSGEYRGIGVVVYKDSSSGYVVVDTVMKDQPAYNAGVENGDILISVDGKKTNEITLTETVALIKKGKADSVKLVLLRGNETLEKEVDKSNIVLESVTYEMKKGKIGYISVNQFIENTDEQFIEAVNDLTSQGMKGLILDLRDNGGGMVDSCCNMLSRLVPEGKLLVYMEDKNGNRDEHFSEGTESLDVPMVILVNGNTASASEIMTGCLKDYKMATVLGSTTFGKGIVQNIIPLGDGTAIKLTVAGYYTPNGNNIHKKGIEPDVKMEYTAEEWREVRKDPSKDTQLDKAISILKGK